MLDRWHNCLLIYWCTSCLVPTFDYTKCYVPATEWCHCYRPCYLFSVSSSFCFSSIYRSLGLTSTGILLVFNMQYRTLDIAEHWVGTFLVQNVQLGEIGGLVIWLFKLFHKHHFWTRVRYDHRLPISRGSQAGLLLCRPFWINPRWRHSRASHNNNRTTKSRRNVCKTMFRGFSGMGNLFFVLLFWFYLNVTF